MDVIVSHRHFRTSVTLWSALLLVLLLFGKNITRQRGSLFQRPNDCWSSYLFHNLNQFTNQPTNQQIHTTMSEEWDLQICCMGAGYVGGPTMAIIAKMCPKVRKNECTENVLPVSAMTQNLKIMRTSKAVG